MTSLSSNGAVEMGLRKKIVMVRDALLELNINNGRAYSKDDINIALNHYDFDVDRTVQAFLEDGAVEALAEWNKPGRAAGRPATLSSSANAAILNGELDTNANSSAHAKKKKRKNKSSGNGVANGDANVSENGLENVAAPNSDSPSASVTPTHHASPDCLAPVNSQLNGHSVANDSSVQHQPSETPADLCAKSLTVGEHFIQTVLSANIAEHSSSLSHNSRNPLEKPASDKPMTQRRAKRTDTSKKASHDRQTSSNADLSSPVPVLTPPPPPPPPVAQPPVLPQRVRNNSTPNTAAVSESLSRAEHELSRFTMEFERRRQKCTRDLDATASRIDRQFHAAREHLSQRHHTLVSEFTSTRSAVQQYLDARLLVANMLRERIVRLQTAHPSDSPSCNGEASLEDSVDAIRNDVRALSSSLTRRIDEAAFGTIRFEFDDSALFNAIDLFGNVVPFNPARIGRSTSTGLDPAQVPETSCDSDKLSQPPQTVTVTPTPTSTPLQSQETPKLLEEHETSTPDSTPALEEHTTPRPDSQLLNSPDSNREDSQVHHGRRSNDYRRESRRTVTYQLNTAPVDDQFPTTKLHSRSATTNPPQNWQPPVDAERDSSASRRRFHGDFNQSFPNSASYEYSRYTNLKHSHSHPTYVDADGYSIQSYWNWNGNEYLNDYSSKRPANAGEYAAHNGFSSNYPSSRNYFARGYLQSRYPAFDPTAPGRPNSFELDSRNTYPHPRDRDSRFNTQLRGNRNAAHGPASPHSSAPRFNRPSANLNQTNSNGSRSTPLKDDPAQSDSHNDDLQDANVAERPQNTETAPRRASEQPAEIDWVNVVEQDEQARLHDSQAKQLDAPLS